MRTLVIGNRCYSSWSFRPWLLMKALGIPFDEVQIVLDRPDSAEKVARYSPAGRVPVLVDDGVTVWDSIAIIEYLAEHVEPRVWPHGREAKALARSIVAEMHAGFPDLRRNYPMNLGKRYAYRERPEAAKDVARVQALIMDARRRFGRGGPFLFGAFTAADAYYAPVMSRFATYAVPVEPAVRTYMEAVFALPAYQGWRTAALAEPWVIAGDEIDDEPIEVLRKGAIVA